MCCVSASRLNESSWPRPCKILSTPTRVIFSSDMARVILIRKDRFRVTRKIIPVLLKITSMKTNLSREYSNLKQSTRSNFSHSPQILTIKTTPKTISTTFRLKMDPFLKIKFSRTTTIRLWMSTPAISFRRCSSLEDSWTSGRLKVVLGLRHSQLRCLTNRIR